MKSGIDMILWDIARRIKKVERDKKLSYEDRGVQVSPIYDEIPPWRELKERLEEVLSNGRKHFVIWASNTNDN